MTAKEDSLETSAQLTEFAAWLADMGGQTALKWFREKYDIDLKDDKSPVTIADKTTEQHLRELIRQRFPHHGVLGEEFGKVNADAEYIWSIDPIDGTRSFVTGSPIWGTLVALLHHGVPSVGAVKMPALNEKWYAAKGEGCWQVTGCQGPQRCVVSGCRNLEQARFYTTSPFYFSLPERSLITRLAERVWEARFGGDCYIYCLLASGYIDLVVESQLHYFDYMPLISIVQEAGGIITDWEGQPLGFQSDGRVVAAATEELHRKTLDLLAQKEQVA